MGCNESYKGGRCKGVNVENCIYESASDKGADKCAGSMKLLKVPDDSTCTDQKGLYKCVLSEFENKEACIKVCPGKCKGK